MANITKMKNAVVVDDGTREIPIVNKFGKLICKIHIRPADFSIIDRYNDMVADLENMVAPLKDLKLNADGTATFDEDWKTLKQVEADLKNKLNLIFDMDEADAIFATRNPFSSVGGKFYCMHVLSALQKVIADAVDEESKLAADRVSPYLDDLKPSAPDAEVTENAGTTANEP